MNELIIFAVAAAILVLVAMGGLSAAPWLPTKRRERRLLLEKISVEPGQVVYDLGCGDGAVLFDLAQRQSAATYIGYEIAVLPLLIGRLRKLLGGPAYAGVSVRGRDFFGQPLADADIIFIFLLDTSYPKVIRHLRSCRLNPNSRVIVEAWRLPEIEPDEVIRDDTSLPLYLYRGERFQ